MFYSNYPGKAQVLHLNPGLPPTNITVTHDLSCAVSVNDNDIILASN